MGILILSGNWKVLISREKTVWGVVLEPVPQTDTGGLVENTKAFEKEWFKELGKKAGRNLWEKPSPTMWGRSKGLPADCLSKTQLPANPNRRSIGGEA